MKLDIAYLHSDYDESKIVIDQQELETRGYMQSPNDWKNVEMTGYVKLISTTGSNFAKKMVDGHGRREVQDTLAILLLTLWYII
jgi:hypothetical protein